MNQKYRVDDIKNKISSAGFRPLDVLLVGATGVGKSSTLNALFGDEVAKVGEGVAPETMNINPYEINDYLRIWDSPGLGDGVNADRIHKKRLTNILCKTYEHSDGEWGFIDLVVVILDGGSRDMGTSYKLLEDVILKNIQENRVLVAINQADMAMKGRNWDRQNKTPSDDLLVFLESKADSITARLKEATGIEIKRPIFYSATEQYNLNELMDNIIEFIPKTKRTLEIN